MDGFYEKFLDNLSEDELRTIFTVARQNAKNILGNSVCQEFPVEDACIMALSLAVAAELVRRYESEKD